MKFGVEYIETGIGNLQCELLEVIGGKIRVSFFEPPPSGDSTIQELGYYTLRASAVRAAKREIARRSCG